MLAFILSLSMTDYSHLAKVIQVEAARGTMDEYCVAVSVLNRVRSPHFPNTVASVVYSPGQYEGLSNYNISPNLSILNRIMSKDGQKKLLSAYSIIGDRTDFKGQRMLKYRVASEDPMCHNKGNFYHYHWQT